VGGVTELVGPRSSGRTAVAYAVAAAVTATGALAACVDLPDALDAGHAQAAGIRLANVLWVRPPDERVALRVAEQILGAGGFRLVLIDLGEAPSPRVAGMPAVWMRLGRAAVRSGAIVVTVGGRRSAGACAALSLEISRRQVSFSGEGGPCPLFEGIDGRIRLRRSRALAGLAADARLFAATAA